MFAFDNFAAVLISIFICSSNASFLETTCMQPMNVGEVCNGRQPSMDKYYFDVREERCIAFSYLGCGGNRNKFNSSYDCIDSCQTQWLVNKNNKEYKRLGTETPRQKSDCLLKPEKGPCKALITMWFFNSTENACFVFGYGGCQGDPNKFDTKPECERFCKAE